MKDRKQAPSRAARWSEEGKSLPAGHFFIAGLNGVRECAASPHLRIQQIWADPKQLTPEIWAALKPHQSKMEEIKGDMTPYGPVTQGIGALVLPPKWPEFSDLLDQLGQKGEVPLIVALDQVEDPMNLGQLLRTCEGAGVHAVILTKHRSVHLNQTVAQVSQGAFAWVPLIEVTNLRQAIDEAKAQGLWVFGCEAGPASQAWNKCDFTSPAMLIFGSEGKGMRPLTAKSCDLLAALPMRGRINSLNVGAAVSAMLYEVLRQRGQ